MTRYMMVRDRIRVIYVIALVIWKERKRSLLSLVPLLSLCFHRLLPQTTSYGDCSHRLLSQTAIIDSLNSELSHSG